MKKGGDTAIIITSFAEKMNLDPVLGTGGWLPPDEREALDWMTLISLMGWEVQLQSPQSFQIADLENTQTKWLIVTGDPDAINSNIWEQFLSITKTKKILLITSAGKKNGWLSDHFGVQISGNEINSNYISYYGQGPCKEWKLRKSIQLRGLEIAGELDELVTTQGACIAASSNESGGKVLFFSFHPSVARDTEPVFTALLRHLLIVENSNPVAWFDWGNTLILRMDDPGSAQPVYDNSFQHTKLGEKEWEAIGEELYKRKGRMSLAYVSAWVDDGNSSRGQLEIDKEPVSRALGNVYPSPLVKYIKTAMNGAPRVFDYAAEFRGIQKLRKEGLVETELHGYTHMHPDRESWGKATDQYENKMWYREFARSSIRFVKSLPEDEHPLHLGIKAFFENFQSLPSTLICPGEEFTNDVLERAMQAGFKLVSSYYLGMRISHQLCWNQHVCSPYLDLAGSHWLDSELPVVGYFHDFDISINGTDWFTNCLENWQKAGVKYFIDFRKLAGVLSHTISLNKSGSVYQLKVQREDKWKTIHPARVSIYVPETRTTLNYECDLDQSVYEIDTNK